MSRSSPSPTTDDRVFLAALLGATFLMGASFIAGKTLVAIADPLALAGWRFVVAAIATLPLVMLDLRTTGSLTGRRLLDGLSFPVGQWPIVILIGLVQTGLVMGLLFLSMESLSAPAAAILLFTNPLWVGMAAPFFLGDRLSAGMLAGLLLGVVGVALAIGYAGVDGAVGGYLLGLGSGMAWAWSTIIQKRTILTLRPFALAFWQMLIGGLALLVVAAATGDPWIDELQGWDWAWFAWLAVPSSAGSFGLWAVALSRGGAARSSGFLFLAPLFAVLLSALILNASLDPIQVLGGVMVGLAIWAINRPAPQRLGVSP